MASGDHSKVSVARAIARNRQRICGDERAPISRGSGCREQGRLRSIGETLSDGRRRGLLWANAQLKAQKGSPFFCDPDDVSLTTTDYLTIVDGETKQPYVQPEYPVELFM